MTWKIRHQIIGAETSILQSNTEKNVKAKFYFTCFFSSIKDISVITLNIKDETKHSKQRYIFHLL